MINSLIELLSYINDLKKLKDMLYDSETHLYSIKEIEIYISCVELIDKSYSLTKSIKSNTLKGLFTYLHGIKESEARSVVNPLRDELSRLCEVM